jgi:uncharacterized protein
MIRVRPAIAYLALTLVAACASSPKPQYYVLTSEAGAPASAVSASALSIAVGPVTVPDLVDQPRIVIQAAGNQVAMEEYQRWASPLTSEIAHVIAANLGRELGTTHVASYLQNALPNPDVQVVVDVRRFESRPGNGVTIDVLWGIRRKAGGAVKTGQSMVHEPVSGGDVNDLVAAHSRALARVSRDIAGAIRSP